MFAFRAAVALAVFACCFRAAAQDTGWRLATRADVPAFAPAARAPAVPAGAVVPDGRWAFVDPVTGQVVSRPAAQPGNALTRDLLRDGVPGPDLRVQQTPEGWLHLDTRGLRHFRIAQRRHDGQLAADCRQGDRPPPALAGWPDVP